MSTSPFFRLSRELRDRIYHFALLNERARFHVRNVELEARYIIEPSEYDPLDATNPHWLLTSRQILSEGLDQFYIHAKLESSSIASHPRYAELTLNGRTSIFDLGRIKTAALRLQLGSATTEGEGGSCCHLVPQVEGRSYKDDEGFIELLKIIKSLTHSAFETLKLTVWLFDTGDHGKPTRAIGNENYDLDGSDSEEDGYDQLPRALENIGYLINFEFLKELGTQWKNVHIEYIPTYMLPIYEYVDPVPANIIAVPMIQDGLVEIAKYLVGAEGWIVRDDVRGLRWLLDVERRPVHKRTQKLEHLGLKKYLAKCGNCHKKKETFVLQPDEGDGMQRFMGEVCQHIKAYKIPIIRDNTQF